MFVLTHIHEKSRLNGNNSKMHLCVSMCLRLCTTVCPRIGRLSTNTCFFIGTGGDNVRISSSFSKYYVELGTECQMSRIVVRCYWSSSLVGRVVTYRPAGRRLKPSGCHFVARHLTPTVFHGPKGSIG